MDKQHIRQVLQAIAQEEVKDDMDMWPQIKSQMAANSPLQQRGAFRLLRASAALMILVAVSAVTYAVYQEIINGDPGLQAVDRDNKIIHFNQTKPVIPTNAETPTDYDLNVTLDYAYADANRITVSLTTAGQARVSESVSAFANPTLYDANGQELYRMPHLGGGGGSGGGRSDVEDPIVGFNSLLTANFDASSITDAPESIPLRLVVEVAYSTAELQGGMLLAGTVEFEFSLPFNPGRTADVGQTVTAGGLEMTLQKVTVSPSLTRLEMCYDDPSRHNYPAVPFAQVEIDGEVVVPETQLTLAGLEGQPLDADNTCRALDIPQALQNEGGDWTITITRLRLQASENLEQVAAQLKAQHDIIITPQPEGGFSYDTPSNADQELWASIDAIVADAQETIEGPWTFNFTLP